MKIGVSRCLLGDAVRYDGQSKPCAVIIEHLSEQFELIAVCPEVEAGLGIPRPPVQLTGSTETPHITGRDNAALDITKQMQAYCEQRIPELSQLAGFIFKSRSPSCGLGSTPVFIAGQCVTDNFDGVFTSAFKKHYPHAAIIDEIALQDDIKRERFLHQIALHATSHIKQN